MASLTPLQPILPKPAEVKSSTQEQRSLIRQSKKKSHTSIACLRCRARKSKCKGEKPICSACEGASTECIYSAPENPAHAVNKKLRGQYNELCTVLNTLYTQDLPSSIQTLMKLRAAEGPQILQELVQETTQEPPPRLSGLPKPFPLMQPNEFTPDEAWGSSHSVQPARKTSRFPLNELPVAQWTRVPMNEGMLNHLLALFWTWDNSLARIIDQDLFLEHLRARSNPAPNIKATIPGGFCSEVLVNAVLAVATMYYGEISTPGDSVRAQGRVFADETLRLLDETEQPPSIPLLQGLAFAWMYEEASGNWDRASKLLENFFYLHATCGFFRAEPAPQTTEGETIDNRVQHALASIAWGIYSLDAKMHILLARPMWTKMPVLPKPFQGDALLSHGSLDGTWYPYPISNQGQPSYRKEGIRAECDFAEFADRALYYAEEDRISVVPDYVKSKALYKELLQRKCALHEQFGNERGLIPPKMVLQLYYDILALRILRPYTRLSFLEPDGGQTALCLSFQHSESIVSNLWNYRAAFGMRLGYWMAQACRNAAVTVLPHLPRAISQGDTFRKACELLYEMKMYIPFAGQLMAVLKHTMIWQAIEVPSGAKKFFED